MLKFEQFLKCILDMYPEAPPPFRFPNMPLIAPRSGKLNLCALDMFNRVK